MSNSASITELCNRIGLADPEPWHEYFRLVKSWAAKTDLTSARTDEELAEILFLDAAFVLRGSWCSDSLALLDVGAGVGAPTIPLLLFEESLRGTLVEPRRIRATFLRTAAGSLDLAGRARVLEQKVDPKSPALAGAPFDVALSRATFAPSEWLRIGATLATEVWVLTAGGEPDAAPEMDLVRRLDYQVPSSGAPRAILAYRARTI
jgi:16S rRNA (guanine527-N7)-methyltransferase